MCLSAEGYITKRKTAHNEYGQYIALKGTTSNHTRRDVALEKLLEVSLTFKECRFV